VLRQLKSIVKTEGLTCAEPQLETRAQFSVENVKMQIGCALMTGLLYLDDGRLTLRRARLEKSPAHVRLAMEWIKNWKLLAQ
jgi:hypothetical protein